MKFFYSLSKKFSEDSFLRSFFHLLSEVEVVFGFWAFVFIFFFSTIKGFPSAMEYLDHLHFTEAVFVFCIMVMASVNPILELIKEFILSWSQIIHKVTRIPEIYCEYFIILTLGPLSGSLITEPAAMTLTALLLVQTLTPQTSSRFMYILMAFLFVNISVGGALTPFAAPPLLMVVEKWGWNFSYVFFHFGIRSFLTVFINALVFIFLTIKILPEETLSLKLQLQKQKNIRSNQKGVAHKKTWGVTLVFFFLLLLLILSSHYAVASLGTFLLFLGVSHTLKKYVGDLRIRDGLLVGFFLSGLIVFGSFQSWWLTPLLNSLSEITLYYSSILLTSVTDNAALTYLGTQVTNLTEQGKYHLVAGALAGGGLTLIANAPNLAGYSIMQHFYKEGFNSLHLLKWALIPTSVAAFFLSSFFF